MTYYYIVMRLTDKNTVEKVFERLTDLGFLWADRSSPVMRMHSFLFHMDYETLDWEINNDCYLVIDLNNKELTYGRGNLYWSRDSVVHTLTDVETLYALQQDPIILNGGDKK